MNESILEKTDITDQSNRLNIDTITDRFFQSWDKTPPNGQELLIGALVDYFEHIASISFMTVGLQIEQYKRMEPRLDRMKKIIGVEPYQEKISIDEILLSLQKNLRAHPPSKRGILGLKIINYYQNLSILGFSEQTSVEEQLLLYESLKKQLDELQISYQESLDML